MAGMVGTLLVIAMLRAPVGAQRPVGQVVTGVAVDATGAVLPGAQVELTGTPTGPRQSAKTDPTGMFRFEGVPPGRYEVLVTFEGFRPTTARVTVGSRAPSPLRI